ncbi:MAG: hypothetical protein IT423_03675 [Pirellulaceae bacterium]|nr:hypothetical protein [Pirellulaceae bacterium]
MNGPYHCASSAADGSLTWLCHEHAVRLSGTPQTYHPERVPSCSSGSGQRADFWCMGVRCQLVGGRPWGREQVAAGNGHGSPYVCRRCHHAATPVCAVAHCAQVAYQHCEYVDPESMRPCRQKLCSTHGYKWQIYGPEKEGLNLCPTHANLRTYSDEGIVEQMVLGTALRRRQQGRSHDALRVQLPTLLTTRHIFLNVRQVPYDLIELRTMFHAVAERCTAIDLRKRINRLLKLRRDTWDREAIKLQKRRKDALPILKRVQAAYGSLGLDAVANSLRCADMIQLRSGQYPYRLLVYVAPGEIANFKGVGCGTLHRVEKLVGVELWLERDQQGQRRR